MPHPTLSELAKPMPQPPWMPVAWTELGQREIAGAGTNPRIAAYFRRAGHPEIRDDETAWCAAFVGFCLEDAGLKSTRSLAARSYLTWGAATDLPVPGAITVLSRSSDPSLGHVGFLAGFTDTRVYLLGGNQSGSVSVAAFDRSRVLGFRLPSAADVPTGSAVGTAADRPVPDVDPGFDAALAHVLAFEGGWSDDPFDPGGATNKGITLATLARWRGVEVTAETVERLKSQLHAITDDEVRRIFLERYWRPARCPDLPPPLAFMHFDCAVNQGVGGATRMLQEAIGVATDGEIGPLTLAAARSASHPEAVMRYSEIRRRRYQGLVHFWRFGRGWIRRLDATTAAARSMSPGFAARAKPANPTSLSPAKERPSMTDKTFLPDVAREPVAPATQSAPARDPAAAKWWGESLTIWGALLTAVSTVAPTICAAFGIDVSADLIMRLGRDAVTIAQAVAGLVGTVMTVLGRIRATAPLERRAVSIHL